MNARLFAMLGMVAIALIAGCGTARADLPAIDPRVVIHHEKWTSSDGNCTADIEHASVAGVAPETKVRIDGILEQQLAKVAVPPSWYGTREVNCARAVRDAIRFFGADKFTGINDADWTIGLTHGRWISVRLHVEQYSGAGQAHPTDFYTSTTFDLAHGGYPVPASGYFLRSQRARFDDDLTSGWFASTKSRTPDASAISFVHHAIESAVIDEHSIMLTSAGIEVCGLGPDEASRTIIVAVPYADLRGVGTPGGPLDSATR